MMCQLTESFTPLKLIEFCCKSGRPVRQKCLEWLEIKVFYIKIVDACGVDRAPQCLTVHYLPRSTWTDLEVNGKQIRPSASAFVTLRRSGIDGDPSDWTFVSTDSVRTTGKLCFEVYVSDETLLFGALDRRKDSVSDDCQLRWTVECTCALEYPSKWSSTEISLPSIEVSMAGRDGRCPVILTRTEELVARKKRVRQGATLDAIPEGNDYENSLILLDCDATEYQGRKKSVELDEKSIVMMCEALTE
ncbi:hypothetical protein KI387_007869, partial [Taxus chinensis]